MRMFASKYDGTFSIVVIIILTGILLWVLLKGTGLITIIIAAYNTLRITRILTTRILTTRH